MVLTFQQVHFIHIPVAITRLMCLNFWNSTHQDWTLTVYYFSVTAYCVLPNKEHFHTKSKASAIIAEI